ncbi:MAG: DNA methyltransferase, partial [Thermoguttaceae bacterium]
MPLSWTEIRERAVKFSQDWNDSSREKSDAQTFWNEFFSVFGVQRRTVASFEEPVKNIKGQYGYIDLFWRGKLLAEHKSAGKDLTKAASQAFEYIQCLKNQGRDDEIPQYVAISDFRTMILYNLEPDEDDLPVQEISVKELHKHIHSFAFIPGYKVHKLKKEDPANIQAAELMGKIHDVLFANGYSGHNLERFLVRILFCLFAEDTGIFEPNAFTAFIENCTREDGADLGRGIAELFEVLNTPDNQRQKNLDEFLVSMRYINGGLFEEPLKMPACNRAIRNALLSATRFDWSHISPAIFGSMFQCVMDPEARRACGAHYTTEENILKVIRPLFLDDLRNEFNKIKSSKAKLNAFHEKLGNLTFFDPACGCGNFLVLAYRELRRLEMDVFEKLHKSGQKFLDTAFVSQVDVDQFYGIEIVEFPVRIAETALWLMDHQMNIEASERFGNYYVRLPLQKSAKIVHGNALQLDWNDVLPKQKCSFILGNPPFVGKNYRSKEQTEDIQLVCQGVRNFGSLDYVACWYIKAAKYIQETVIPVGFVSTNSIAQGEQVEFLWEELYKWSIHINFAYQTFVWTSEAKGKAHVHCVIIGFSAASKEKKQLFAEAGKTFFVKSVSSISPYLFEGSDIYVTSRRTPLCTVPEMVYGSKPADGGFLMVSNAERKLLAKHHPECIPYLRPILGSEEFINNIKRWCFWLVDVNPREIMSIPEIRRRVEQVKAFRLQSKKEP